MNQFAAQGIGQRFGDVHRDELSNQVGTIGTEIDDAIALRAARQLSRITLGRTANQDAPPPPRKSPW